MKKDELNGQDPTAAAEDPNRYFGVRIFFVLLVKEVDYLVRRF
jgi:hypothetical protein